MTADGLFEQIAADLADDGVRAGAMFGKRALLIEGKTFACLKGDELAFRLGAGSAVHSDAVSLPGAALFDPSGKGRPFKDWVAVPLAHSAQWSALAQTALQATRP